MCLGLEPPYAVHMSPLLGTIMPSTARHLTASAALAVSLMSPVAQAGEGGLSGWGKAYAKAEARRLEEIRIREEAGGELFVSALNASQQRQEDGGQIDWIKYAAALIVPGLGLALLLVD